MLAVLAVFTKPGLELLHMAEVFLPDTAFRLFDHGLTLEEITSEGKTCPTYAPISLDDVLIHGVVTALRAWSKVFPWGMVGGHYFDLVEVFAGLAAHQ